MITGLASRAFKQDLWLFSLSMLCGLLFAIHFYLLDQPVAALANGLAAFRYLIFFIFGKDNKHPVTFSVTWLIVTYFVVIAAVSPSNVSTLVAVASVVMGAGLTFYNGIKLRLCFAIGDLIWLAISLITWSIGGVILDLVAFAITMHTCYRIASHKQATAASNELHSS